MKTKCYLFLFMLLFCVGQAIAQGINVTGTVIDETGEPVIGLLSWLKEQQTEP